MCIRDRLWYNPGWKGGKWWPPYPEVLPLVTNRLDRRRAAWISIGDADLAEGLFSLLSSNIGTPYHNPININHGLCNNLFTTWMAPFPLIFQKSWKWRRGWDLV